MQSSGHELTLHVGALASIGSATHVLVEVEHTGVEPEQLWHATPPLPHVAVDMPPTHCPSLQQPPQFDVEHTGAASGAASCPPAPAS